MKCLLLNRGILLVSVLQFIVYTHSFGITWDPAYPYIQKMEGQKITIKATPYAPYDGISVFGKTEVYLGDTLLYTIDRYFREKIVTSHDGKFLVVVYFSNAEGIASYTLWGQNSISYNFSAIEIFKDGNFYKRFSLKEVIDTTSLVNNGLLFNWAYDFDYEGFEWAQWGCEACVEVYGKDVLNTCDTAEINLDECEECRQSCDSVVLRDIELNIVNNPLYLEKECIYMITNQASVVSLSLVDFELKKLSFDEIIPNKETYRPKNIARTFDTVELPDKFDEATLLSGESVVQGVNAYLQSLDHEYKSCTECKIYINYIVIDTLGRCADFIGYIKTNDGYIEISKYSNLNKVDRGLTNWLDSKRFKTDLIPIGFDKYAFRY